MTNEPSQQSSPTRPTPSAQQEAVCAFVCKSPDNLVVRARAGTGKTWTILEALRRYVRLYPEAEVLIAAFNKRIAVELQQKTANTSIAVSTLHSLGFRAITSQWRGVRINRNRGQDLARKACGDQAPDDMVNLVRRLAAMGKNCAPNIKAKSTDTQAQPGHLEQLRQLALEFDLDPDPAWAEDGWDLERIASCAQKAMLLALCKDGEIDFDDQIFIPVANAFARPAYRLVVIDEAQDMNQAQLRLAYRLCVPRAQGGRLIVVGDDRQAIYRFRGADSGALDRLKTALEAHELPLTITYRCAQAIVEEAQALVPDYQAAPNAPRGVVRKALEKEMYEQAAPGDAILSRRNAELASACMRLLKIGKRARIEGRDIGEGLLRLVESLKAKNWKEFGPKLERWREREVAKITAKHKGKSPDALAEACDRIHDQADTLHSFSEGLRSVAALVARIRELFSDSHEVTTPAIVCSSVHKAKGLEWQRVWGLDWTFGGKGKRTDAQEEANIEYVFITRAQKELVRVVRPGERRR